MYILLLTVLLYLAARLIRQGLQRRSPRRQVMGAALLLLTLSFYGLMSLWGEWLWFENLGYGRRFWTLLLAQVGVIGLGLVSAGSAGYVLAYFAGGHLRRLVMALCALAGAIWGWQNDLALLLFVEGVTTTTRDPLLQLQTSFYLFSLPFFAGLFWLAFSVALIALLAALFVWEYAGEIRLRHLDEAQGHPWVLPMANAGLAWVLAAGMVLAVCHLLYSTWGVVQGPGWVDVHVLYPALLCACLGFVLVGVLPLFPVFRRFAGQWAMRRLVTRRPAVAAMAAVWAGISLVACLLLVVAPVMVQWLIVKPNEITFEKSFIANNIDFTRQGFGLDRIEAQPFVPAAGFSQETIDNNSNLLAEVRLWDWRALDAVYRQFQEIRLYYEFVDVDIDRYQLGDRYRQLMVSAREFGQHNLSLQSQTFVNKRFKYTHGYGYTAAAVSDFTVQGLPNLLVQDIPPVAKVPELAVTRPEIYYGELTTEAAVVNTREAEFDYPSGDTNVYTRYQGRGGVQLSNLWRKLLFGWKLDGSVLLFSSYPTAASRVQFHRQISERVERLAPFLTLDADPYIVASGGRLYWIIDGYTTSDYYPYSQAFDARSEGVPAVPALHQANYVRNSVKAVVDAYHGSVDFYVFDETDPIVQTWQQVFPDLFKPRAAMPEDLVRHVRYPNDFLLVQGLIYSQYHMTDPEVFYNQEDLWVRATEKHYRNIVPVEPYYVMWELPGSDQAEFVLILPFTPKNKQVLIGWIAGLSDGENYGRFLAYNFPKEARMLGPQQVETKIDQDAFLSGQLTLWDQQGSEVIRGNVLAIPLDNTLLYVEPIYLRAETAAYPELRLVVVMHGDQLSYAANFADALAGLVSPQNLGVAAADSGASLTRRANTAFNGYLAAQGRGDFQTAASHLQALQAALQLMLAADQDGIDSAKDSAKESAKD
ncbi:MAG: UPF0182 family protein [Pseudomonadales bacterium]|nr:UPF0182 family protein [Pseudomonadales bacterium]